MRYLCVASVLATFTCSVLAQDPALAQDRVTLTSGEVLTGTIKSMADGELVFDSTVIGEVKVPMDKVSDLVTKEQIRLQSKSGDLNVRARVAGIEGGNLRLVGELPTFSLAELGKINPPDKEAEWEGSLNVGATWTNGNSDRRAAAVAFNAALRRIQDRITVDASWNYAEDKDNDPTSATFRSWTLSERRADAGIKYDYYLTKKWYAFVNSRVLGDTLADIQLRYSGGVGLGYTWIEDADTTFLTEVGIAYVNESYRTPGTESVDYMAARVAYKLTHSFSEDTKLVHGVEAYPSVEDADDIYLQAKTELSTKLSGNLVASLAHVLDYDNTPSVTAARTFERVDNRVILGVGWTF